MSIQNCKASKKRFVAIVLVISLLISLIPLLTFATESEPVHEEKRENECELIVEDESKREQNAKHYVFPDGSYEAVVYADAVHRKDENGNWVDIDNRLYDNDRNGFVSNDERVEFKKRVDRNCRDLFSISENGYTISFSILGDDLKETSAIVRNHSEKYTPEKTETITEQYEKIKKVDNTTTICYNSIINSTSFEYVLKADCIKENIILDSSCDSCEYSYIMNLVGLIANMEEDGSICLYDEKSKECVYSFPAPYMYDEEGATSYEVHYLLDSLGTSEYRLSIVANEDWIKDESRVFPVVIDPTIRTISGVYDTYTYSSYPSTNYGSSSDLWISSGQTTYIKINMPTIPSNATIRCARLYTAYFYHAGVTTGYVRVGAYRVRADWNENTWTWAASQDYTNYGYTTSGSDYQILSAERGATAASPQWVNFDITSTARLWRQNSSLYPNYGIALKYMTNSTNYSVVLKSSESESYNCAYLTVSYYTNSSEIIEDGVYWLSSKAAVGASGNPRLMDVEGNSADINTEIQQWDSVDPSPDKYRAQLFYVKYVGQGFYRIYTFSNPNYCLKIDVSNEGVVTGDENLDSNYTLWEISGSSSYGFTITSSLGSDYAITVPSSITNGLGLEFTPKNSYSDYRNKWFFHRFEGYVLSIVTDPGVPGGHSGGRFGHGFLMIENCSSSASVVGYVTVMPGQTITVGTAGGGPGSSGSSSGEEYNGIFYNREAYHFVASNYYEERYSLSILINDDDLEIINEDYLRNDDYNDWNLVTNNCVYFASTVWNDISNWDVDAYSSSFHMYTPWTLAQSIEDYDWYTTQVGIPETEWYGYCYYDSSDQAYYFVYVEGDDGAFPTIEVEEE